MPLFLRFRRQQQNSFHTRLFHFEILLLREMKQPFSTSWPAFGTILRISIIETALIGALQLYADGYRNLLALAAIRTDARAYLLR